MEQCCILGFMWVIADNRLLYKTQHPKKQIFTLEPKKLKRPDKTILKFCLIIDLKNRDE